MRGITAHSIWGRVAFTAEKAPAAGSGGGLGGRGSSGVQSFLLWWGNPLLDATLRNT